MKNIDGYATFIINKQGHYHHCLEFRMFNSIYIDGKNDVGDYLSSQNLGMELINHLNGSVKDKLVFCTFKMTEIENDDEVEEDYEIVEFKVLKSNYKLYWQKYLTRLIDTICQNEDMKISGRYKDLFQEFYIKIFNTSNMKIIHEVAEWEMLYGEEFTFIRDKILLMTRIK